MLSRAHRLSRHSDFAAAIGSVRGVGRGSLVVHLTIAPLAGGNSPTGVAGTREPRVGFVVSRAVGGAVVRNRVRRRLRHLVREHLADLPPGALLVVRALPPAAGSSYRRLDRDLSAAIDAAGRRAAARENAGGGVTAGAADPAPRGGTR